MALYAFDGTGNEDHDETDDSRDSNVADFFEGYLDPNKNSDTHLEQGSLYLKGIGTRGHEKLMQTFGKVFGFGGHPRVHEALGRLVANQAAGDTEVDIVGFSRGAALAVAFANEIDNKFPAISIRFLGVWDIVAQFGVPGKFINLTYKLGMPKNTKAVYHAMAMDESRAMFPLTRLQSKNPPFDGRLTEVWFRGVHSDVGGGNANPGMNWIALNWMFEAAVRAGLPIDPAAVAKNLADSTLPQQISDHKLDARIDRHYRETDILHSTVQLVAGIPGRPHNNPPFALSRIDDSGNISV